MSRDAGRMPGRFRTGACLAVVMMLTAVAYVPALEGPLLFDDEAAIQDNPSIASLWPPTAPLHPPAATAVSGRPIANLSLAVNVAANALLGVPQAHTGEPGATLGYHALNLLLHLACGLLLFGVVRRTMRALRHDPWWSARADPVALGVTTLWLLHPLNVDAVAYIVQRTELLVAVFLLATLYASIRAWDSATPGARGRWYVAGVIASILGMGSKEVMVGGPLLVLLYDRAFRLAGWRDLLRPELRGRRWFHVALFASLLVLVLLLLDRPRGTSIGFDEGMPWFEYLHTQGWAIGRYLRLAFIPSGFALDYGSRMVPHWRGLPGLLLLTSLAVLTLAAWRHLPRRGGVAWLGTWCFVILAPSSSVVPIVTEVAAERRMYLPLMSVLTLGVIGGVWVAHRFVAPFLAPGIRSRGRGATRIGGTVLALALAALTLGRSRHYGDLEAAWRDAAEVFPENPRAWYNLGTAVARRSPERAAEAESYFRRTLQEDSTYADAILRLLVADARQGNREEARQLARRFPLVDGNDTVLAHLGEALFHQGDTAVAVIALERAAEAPSRVGTLTSLAMAYWMSGRPDTADAVFRRAMSIAPADPDLLIYYTDMLIDLGRLGDAIDVVERSAGHASGTAVHQALRSLLLAFAGQRELAARAAEAAVREAGGDGRVWFVAGRAMLELRRPDEAADYFTRALALPPETPAARTGLEAAQAMRRSSGGRPPAG